MHSSNLDRLDRRTPVCRAQGPSSTEATEQVACPRSVERQARRSRRRRTASLVWVLLLLVGAPLLGQSLVILRDIEQRLLEAKLTEFEAAHQAEVTAGREATTAAQSLRTALANLDVSVERLRSLESQLAVARDLADRREAEAARLRHDIYDRMERLGELERELARTGVTLWGVYSVDFGPDEGPGTMTLRTEGGRVEGSYQLQSGRRGVLRGALEGDRLQLERIDSERGRDRTLSATLEGDRSSIRGTWVARELASGEQSSGIWRAVRLDEEAGEQN